jgi:tetratricopeptide (TPR) repeat protein
MQRLLAVALSLVMALVGASLANAQASTLPAARKAFATGRYADAEQIAARAAIERPDLRAAAATVRAEALAAQGKLDEAEAAFAEAVLSPTAFRARALYARLLIERGRVAEAQPLLQELIEAYNHDELGPDRAATLAYVAMAARMKRSPHDANDAFREAALADRTRVETQLEWAELFLDKRDLRHARESAEEALESNPKSPRAHVLMARLQLLQSYDFEQAEEHLAAALKVNPALVTAHVTRAAMALREMDVAVADKHLDAALAINPNHLEALSVRAAARFLADDAAGFARAKSAVLTRNPRFSRMYSIIADHAEWEHRYPELIEMAQQALAIDPEDPGAHATLAINLLRSGREKEGRPALEEAWKRDRFNAQIFNLLNLYERVIAEDYEDFSVEPFTFRMHKEERKVLEPYVPVMMRTAYGIMKQRYGFTPEGPLRLEMYADDEHFSVRTTGMPNVGVQGVCFGKVITAVSPAAGPFNWGQITWHELAHVFHLQLSKNHVPRWFTEGLAEHETVVARAEWRREEDSALYTAFAQDRVPRLIDLNRAFTQAKSPQALMTAYYLASLSVAYLVERFGWDKMRPMLIAWGEGKRTPEVFTSVLGVSIDAVDRDLRAHLKKRLSRFDRDFHIDFSAYEDLPALRKAAKAAPKNADAQAGLALGLVSIDRVDEAEQAANRALAINPKHAGALFAMTRVGLEHKDIALVERSLRGILATGQDGYVLRALLARAALIGKKLDQAVVEAEAAIAIDPDQLEGYKVLLDVAVARKARGEAHRPLARRALEALARIDQHDPTMQLALIAALREDKDFAALRKAAENAMFLVPGHPDVHLALGEGLLAAGQAKAALVELDRALELGHSRREAVEAARAEALRALGKPAVTKAKPEKPAKP